MNFYFVEMWSRKHPSPIYISQVINGDSFEEVYSVFQEYADQHELTLSVEIMKEEY
jgi:hypothetical protein